MNNVINDELPKGWAVEAIERLGEVRLGKMLDRSKNKGTPSSYLRNINVRWNSFDLADLKTVRVSADEKELFSVRNGDVFVCEGGEPGRSAVWRQGTNDLVYQKALLRFRSNGALVPEWLVHRLRLDAENGMLEAAFSGTTIKHFTRQAFLKYRIPVAPLAEQKRIAGKLESVLGRVDACRARLDRVPALLKRFRQSVLAAATSGKLTEEWRIKNGVNDEWRTALFQDFCDDITVGFVGKMADSYRDSGVPFLRSLNVRPFRFDPRDLKYVSPEFHRSISKSTLRPGDVVVVRTGAPGQCCVIPSELMEANCSDLVIVRCGPELLPQFAVIFINSESSQDFVKAERVGVAQSHFNVGSMKKAPLHLPTLPEQQEIVRRVEALFAFADRIESRLAAAQKTVERLTPATLAKAFRGELVPQDPNDEPAGALLERLKSGEPASSATKTRRKRSATA